MEAAPRPNAVGNSAVVLVLPTAQTRRSPAPAPTTPRSHHGADQPARSSRLALAYACSSPRCSAAPRGQTAQGRETERAPADAVGEGRPKEAAMRLLWCGATRMENSARAARSGPGGGVVRRRRCAAYGRVRRGRTGERGSGGERR
ncbi:hypothetical protein BS78_06G073200 [Paspalum vaginatum]|nr:hypothetical protein BS78_06G073200 [Paspalum vaginatum]